MKAHRMGIRRSMAAVLCSTVLPAGLAHAFEYTGDESARIMLRMLVEQRDKTICPLPGTTVKDVTLQLSASIRAHHPDGVNAFTNQDMYEALTELYPCQFDPLKMGARPTASEELVGAWRIAEDSRALSPHVLSRDPYPVRCGAMAFYPDGDLRSSVSNETPCPETPVGTFAAKHASPQTIAWRVAQPNLLTITRPDEPRFVEVWNVFRVEEPFHVGVAAFDRGDLLLFLVQYNELRGKGFRTLYFRHMQPLPDALGPSIH